MKKRTDQNEENKNTKPRFELTWLWYHDIFRFGKEKWWWLKIKNKFCEDLEPIRERNETLENEWDLETKERLKTCLD